MKEQPPIKTMNLEIGIWYNQDSGHIHIAHRGNTAFISTVCADPDSKRGNPNLFRKFASCLRDAGLAAPD